MPFRKQPKSLQFAGGIESATDHKQVPETKLLDLQNGIFSSASTISKRNGYEALSRAVDGAAMDYSDAVGLASRGDELIVFDGRTALSYRESSGTWANTGDVASVVASTPPIARTGTVQSIPDSAVVSGVQAIAWEDSRGGVWCSVLEEGTQRILLAQTQLDADGRTPRCVYVGGVIHVLWARPAARRIYVATINPSNASTAPTPAILTEDLSSTNPVYDAESLGQAAQMAWQDDAALIAWARDGGGFRVGTVAASGVLGSPVTGLPSVVTFADSITGPIAVTMGREGATDIAVVWTDAATARVSFLEAGAFSTTRTAAIGSALTSCARIACCFGPHGSDTLQALYWALQISGAQTDLSVVRSGRALITSTDDDTTTQTVLRGHVLLSRAFYDGPELLPTSGDVSTGHVYACVAHAARFYPYAACVRLSASGGIAGATATCVARLLPGESTGTHMRRISAGPTGFEEIRHVSSVSEIGLASGDHFSRVHAVPIGYRIQLDSEDGDQFAEAGIKYCSLDFDHAASYQTAEFGRGLYLAGAAPQHYDGDRWVEADYHCAPDWGFLPDGSAYTPSTAFVVANAGGSLSEGTYLYRCWYEDIDAQGELHPGPTSVSVSVVIGAGEDQVTISIPTYRLTNKRRVRLCVARSEVNQTGEPNTIPFYRVTGIDPGTTTGANCMVFNDTTVDSVSFVDRLSDADLIKREPLYTNGGVLSNDPAPWSGAVIAGGKNRLFYTDSTDPNLVRFTQERREETGMEAPVALSLPFPPDGGPIVGLAVLDEAVIGFKETAIYSFAGPGPLANPNVQPEGFSFTPARSLPSDTGCVSPGSISTTPIGVIYQSPSGVSLVSREQQVVDIGQPVDAYNSQRLVRATALPDRHQILMLTDGGSSLLWDYEHQQWSRFTNHEGYDATIVGGVYHYLRADGRVFRETPGVYADDNSHITMAIETAWIKFTGYLQGFQKIIHAKFIGEYISSHKLQVSYRLDYQAAYSAPQEIDVDSDYDPDAYGVGEYGDGAYGGAGGPTNVYQQQVHINRRCQAISFKIQDVQDYDVFGASFELSELLLTGGILRESFAPGPTRSQ